MISKFDHVLLYGFCGRQFSVSIHSRNLQVLATELYKSKQQLSQTIMKEKFRLIKNRYNLWRNTIFGSRSFRTQKYSVESLAYLSTKNVVVSTRGHKNFCLVKYF